MASGFGPGRRCCLARRRFGRRGRDPGRRSRPSDNRRRVGGLLPIPPGVDSIEREPEPQDKRYGDSPAPPYLAWGRALRLRLIDVQHNGASIIMGHDGSP